MQHVSSRRFADSIAGARTLTRFTINAAKEVVSRAACLDPRIADAV
ncbi:hypothetical protein PAMC26510_12695 [Caballeronia sordidicola]|uniref:Uncharacterized protein n=1 Tax=Caballeronia sordidicola TaxID=196367 RepID=A0A242MX82_CABSO|nr:hypothetical protein PAMC26577_23810 [Caballeronia sordidicola]OTP75995.1 hypothetical protein PAMC26510_12695 [Caballeronia sordidicola]